MIRWFVATVRGVHTPCGEETAMDTTVTGIGSVVVEELRAAGYMELTIGQYEKTIKALARFVEERSGTYTGTVASVDGSSSGHAWLMSAARCVAPSVAPSAFAGFRFPPEVITLVVRWYLRFGLSYRDVEELLAERGVDVDHVTVFRWVQRFTPLLIDAAQPCRHAPGDRWFIDETYVKVSGRWIYLYRAIDQFGQVIDVLVSEKRDLAAARRFLTQALDTTPVIPVEVITDKAAVYPRVLDELAPGAWHQGRSKIVLAAGGSV
jgi:transposase-like protein